MQAVRDCDKMGATIFDKEGNLFMTSYLHVLWALIYKFFGAGLVFLTSVITARYLGPEARGYLSILINNVQLYSPSVGALSEYMPYGINKRKHDTQAVFATSMWYYAWSAVLFVGIALIGTPWLLHGFGTFDQKSTLTAWIALLVAPFVLFHIYVTRLMIGLNEQQWLNRLNLVQSALFLPAIIIGILLTPEGEDSIFYAFAAWVISFVLTSIISAIAAVKRGKVSLLPRADTLIRKEIWSFGLQLIGSRLLTQINYRVDLYLVFLFLGASTTGVYTVAVAMADMLLLVSNSLLQVVLTRMASLEEGDSVQLTARTFRHTAVIMIATAAFFALTIPFVIVPVFGAEFEPAIKPFLILLPGVALLGTAAVLTAFYTNQLGKPRVLMVLEVVSIAVNVIVSLILLPRMGELGTAWAKTIAYGSVFLITVLLFCRATNYPVRKMFVLQAEEIRQYKSLIAKVLGRVRKKDQR